MPSELIPKTKLQPPALRQPIVLRHRLTDAFNSGQPLTVLTAPAGSGKTTLVLEWLAANKTDRVAWLSLDADDNDPIRFIHGVIAALQRAGEKLHIPQAQRNLKQIVTMIINQLGDVDPLRLVLDDYHVITETAIHETLTYLLDHLPVPLGLVLIAREEPRLSLARLRTRGQLLEFKLDDLRFTVEEADEFLNQIMDLDLPREQIRLLERNTRGWIAGLKMAGLSLQSGKTNTSLDTYSGQFIAEYMLTEIFNQQDEEVQGFLLNTSIFDKFSLALCKVVVPRNAVKLLTRIQKANLFISTVGSWHQYHPLFLEFLQAQLRNRFPERITELRHRAVEWMEKNELIPEAISQALAATDFETAARLIALLAPDYFKRGELVTLRRWLGLLPEFVIWNSPRLCLTQIWLLLDSNLKADAQDYFDRMGTFLERNLRGEFLAVRALHAAMSHRPELALRFATRAQKSKEMNDPFIQTYVSFGMGAAQKMGLAFFKAEQSFREALALADADGNSYIAVSALVNLADVLYFQARLSEAERVCRGAIQRFGDVAADSRDWYWTLARIAYQHNELGEALKLIDQAVDLCIESGDQTARMSALLQRASIHFVLEKRKLAYADLDAADQLARGQRDQVFLRSVIRQRVLFAVHDKDTDAAQRWLDVLAEYGEQPYPFFYAYANGRVCLALGQIKEARLRFASALKDLEGIDFALIHIEVWIWQAVCLSALGKPAEAVKALKYAVKAAQTDKVIRPFIEARSGLWELIDRADRDSFGWVLEIIGGKSKQIEGPALTRREREILQLLTMGMSNQEMAEKLVIAEGTLKRHVANLYQKLGVHNRTQAIRHFNQN